MKNVFRTVLGLAACGAIGVMTYAAVVVDENGVGFVGKGDVQSAFGWNNAQLQANAEDVQFRFVETQQASWVCEWWTGPDHNQQHHTVNREAITSVSANVAYDARRNRQGQITGFNLNGFDGDPEFEGDAIGHCPGTQALQEGSIEYGESDGDAVLEVSVDGQEWLAFDLPIDDPDE